MKKVPFKKTANSNAKPKQFSMARKVPVQTPKETALESYKSQYSGNPEAQAFLDAYDKAESFVFNNRDSGPRFSVEPDPKEEAVKNSLKNAYNKIQNKDLKKATEELIKKQSDHWNHRYNTASGVYYNFSDWAKMLASVVNYKRDDKFPMLF